jgi:hypothetical protein
MALEVVLVTFTIRGTTPKSIFGLAGDDENSATHALGWSLYHSPSLQQLLLGTLFKGYRVGDAIQVHLQRYSSTMGITDLEVECLPKYHAILESKKGWNLPSIEQLDVHSAHRRSVKFEFPTVLTGSAAG